MLNKLATKIDNRFKPWFENEYPNNNKSSTNWVRLGFNALDHVVQVVTTRGSYNIFIRTIVNPGLFSWPWCDSEASGRIALET